MLSGRYAPPRQTLTIIVFIFYLFRSLLNVIYFDNYIIKYVSNMRITTKNLEICNYIQNKILYLDL